ncbi:heavy metal transporter (plasmid) [Rhodococcus oxybenzonivorans]|uniref:Heavy metal transporter n=1 Tax=Rhodococcus oxybenzonivorans TaxID=1990687 RepID=A0A2S2C7G8_9NOCA|nr:cation transporter [Rhodococcus oxybenzonivorans]AWK76809.1 heavy metal transporter [Rhodococcus oxybenzonivorans]
MSTTHTFRVEGMHCGSCALLIDDALDDLPGVRHTWTTKGCTVVALDLHHHSPTDVVDTIDSTRLSRLSNDVT